MRADSDVSRTFRIRIFYIHLAVAMIATMAAMPLRGQQANAAMPSPAMTASVEIAGGTVDVRYNSPRMRGRKIMGDLVPYGQVWRTGANAATTLITSVPLKFGNLLV